MSNITVEVKYTTDLSETINEINHLITSSGKNIKNIYFEKTGLLKGKINVILEDPKVNYKLTNAINRKKTSKYNGVYWDKAKNKWKWQIRHNAKKYSGSANSEYDAALAYDEICYKLRKQDAILNFPELYEVVN